MYMDDESILLTMVASCGGIIGWIRSRRIVSDLCDLKYDGTLVDRCTAGTYLEGQLEISSSEAQGIHSELIEMVYVPEILSGLMIGLFFGCVIVGFRRWLIPRSDTYKAYTETNGYYVTKKGWNDRKSINKESPINDEKSSEQRKVRCRHFDEKGKRCDNYFNSLQRLFMTILLY